jgi:hypothetical protein
MSAITCLVYRNRNMAKTQPAARAANARSSKKLVRVQVHLDPRQHRELMRIRDRLGLRSTTEVLRAVINMATGESAGPVANLKQSSPRDLMAAIVRMWLGDAPAHLVRPQMEELAQLSVADLDYLLEHSTRLRDSEIDPRFEGPKRMILERLKRRREVALAIQNAESEGLYEAAEHMTSEVPDADGEPVSHARRRALGV